ncbi:MAG: adenylate/guanylate cyclase domain-containing protein [Stellaceae bacterium]
MADTRKLAAILTADVAGYSRLTAADEVGTVSRLRALRHELIDPLIAAYHGRIVKNIGDGILIEFPSVVDAVHSAGEVQRGMAARNANLADGSRIEFRVGIHLGDVITCRTKSSPASPTNCRRSLSTSRHGGRHNRRIPIRRICISRAWPG